VGGSCKKHGRDWKYMQILIEKPEGRKPRGSVALEQSVFNVF